MLGTRRIGAGAVFAALVLAGPAPAAILDYTSFHVLGDSLSDTGNVYRATRGDTPESPPYWKGRFSNGPVWADHVADAFEAAGLPTGNYAFGGAEADRDGGFNPDLSFQALLYRLVDSDRRGDRPLVVVHAGANDFKDSVGRPTARRDGRQAADAVGDVASSLTDRGVGDFLMFSLPDLGRVPKYALRDDPADARSGTAFTRAFNRRLDLRIEGLREDGANVLKVDVYALFNALLADPQSFGVRNTRRPCIDDDGNVCTARQAERRAFFDRTHPNAVIHEYLAGVVLDEIEGPSVVATAASPAPVPLPAPAAMLAAGLLALAFVARRRPC